MESINARQLSSLLKPFGIKVVPPWQSERNSFYYEMWTMDGTEQIGLRTGQDSAYGSGWKYTKMLVDDICKNSVDSFVIIGACPPERRGLKVLENPFRGCKTFIEMKVRRDLGAVACPEILKS